MLTQLKKLLFIFLSGHKHKKAGYIIGLSLSCNGIPSSMPDYSIYRYDYKSTCAGGVSIEIEHDSHPAHETAAIRSSYYNDNKGGHTSAWFGLDANSARSVFVQFRDGSICHLYPQKPKTDEGQCITPDKTPSCDCFLENIHQYPRSY